MRQWLRDKLSSNPASGRGNPLPGPGNVGVGAGADSGRDAAAGVTGSIGTYQTRGHQAWHIDTTRMTDASADFGLLPSPPGFSDRFLNTTELERAEWLPLIGAPRPPRISSMLDRSTPTNLRNSATRSNILYVDGSLAQGALWDVFHGRISTSSCPAPSGGPFDLSHPPRQGQSSAVQPVGTEQVRSSPTFRAPALHDRRTSSSLSDYSVNSSERDPGWDSTSSIPTTIDEKDEEDQAAPCNADLAVVAKFSLPSSLDPHTDLCSKWRTFISMSAPRRPSLLETPARRGSSRLEHAR